VTFRGWPAEALEFYEGLEADNSKTFWTEHKQVYDQSVLAPMTDLLAELAGEFGDGKVFRPYRDVRFSPDKTPYKTHIGAWLGDGGYIQLSSSGLAAGYGYYVMAADQLERYREAVAADSTGGELERIIAEARRRKLEVTGHGTLKTTPRGYPRDHQRAELLRHKGLITWKQWPAESWLGTAKAKTKVVTFLRDSKPLHQWLDTNVGSSTLEPAGRR
jgi:uncharacterized protein (TIGR02453 family)